MVNIIKTLKNDEIGIAVYISLAETGKYHVAMEDTDAEEFLPLVKIFPEGDLKRAEDYAATLV